MRQPSLLAGVMMATKNIPPMARPWAQAQAKWSLQDMDRNLRWFNVPEMQSMPTNFFGPTGPGDLNGLARDFRSMRLLMAVKIKYSSDIMAKVVLRNKMSYSMWLSRC